MANVSRKKIEPVRSGRDFLARLVCQVPGCRFRVRAITGAQEVKRLQAHLSRAHLVAAPFDYALELRARWENYDGDWPIKEQ